VLIIIRMRRSAHIKKYGIHVSGRVADLKTFRTSRGGSFDMLTIEYKERANGRAHYARATVKQGKYMIGDPLPVAYLERKPDKYAIGLKTGYLAILIICIILFLFVLFAVYKINEMVKGGSM
jgi:hypothetical protein